MATGQARQPVLLERAEELAALDAVIADTLAGFGRFAVVEGSAGIGKSSLLAETRLRASDAGMAVVTARGTEIERSFAYGAVRQLFERLVAQSDEVERSSCWRARPPTLVGCSQPTSFRVSFARVKTTRSRWFTASIGWPSTSRRTVRC